MAKFTDLTPISGPNMTNSYVFAVSTASDTRSLTLDQLENSFTGLVARTTDGISIFGNTVPSGITVGDNGFIGIDNSSPLYSLHVGDYGGVTNPEFRITGSQTGRSVAMTVADSGVYWQTIKKSNDTDYYIQVSDDDSNYTGVFNITTGGNVGIFDGAADLTDKFFVSGGNVKFENQGSGIIFDPQNAEIKNTITNDIFYINKSNSNDIVIGNDVFYVTNNNSSPTVGIGTTSPSYPLEIHGENTILDLENASSSRSRLRISNNASAAFITLQSNLLNFGSVGTSSSNNLIYDVSAKRLGVGLISPDNKLHVYDQLNDRIVKFEGGESTKSEVFHSHNYSVNDYTGPRTSLYTFGRSNFDGSSTTNNVSKWSIGLYDDGATNTYEDVFVFRVDGDTSSNSAIKAYIDRDGDLDIQGSYTTNGNYSKGKFVQVHETKVTGSDVYFNPFHASSSLSPSGVSGLNSPFGIAPYNGSIEKIQIISVDDNIYNIASSGARFEVSAVTPGSGVDGFVSGFYGTPSSAATSLPTSGIIAQAPITGINSPGKVYTLTSSEFSGVLNFNKNQLVQYRISTQEGVKPDANYTVMSSINYNID